MRLVFLGFLLAIAPLGCADGGMPGDTGGGGVMDAGMRDAAMGDVSMIDVGRADAGRDGGTTMCPSGQHACGTGCIPDLPNEPMNGCRFGCGEACAAPSMGTPSCTTDGMCDFTCPSPFRRMGTMCVCAPRTCMDLGFECGAPDDGCGRPLDCGSCGTGACVMGRCGCTADAREPNDGNTMATTLPETSDDPDADITLSEFNLDAMDDTDWMRMHVVDGFDFGNPRITVTLDNVPVGADYDLAAYYVCDGGGDNATCAAGTVDNFLGRGCADATVGTGISTVEIASDCSGVGIDDDGTLYIRVTPRDAEGCGNYRVNVRIR